MNSDTTSAAPATDHSQSVEDASLAHEFNQPDLISDDDIDYEELFADARADDGTSGIRFDPADYATEDDLMDAVEALLIKWWNEAPDDQGA
jgi:hypothetical protein